MARCLSKRLKVAACGGVLLELASCGPGIQSGPELVELCRPDTVPDKPLQIGDLTIAPGTFEARLSVDETFGEYGVQISLSEVDAARLATLTRSSLNERLPLKIGEVTVFEPVVRTPILDGRILMAGSFTRLGAEDIVRQISPPCLRLATTDGDPATPVAPAQAATTRSDPE